jgi:enoyl-CoA hydratase/carnithine racemase
MVYETLRFQLEDKIGILTLNLPEKLNAHTKQMKKELMHFWITRQNDEASCRVIIMTGAGRAFCAGGDIDEMDEEYRPFHQRNVEGLCDMESEIHDLIWLMRRAPQPIIAAIHGYAAGGGFSIAMAADLRIADPTARFVASFINIGLSGGDMGSTFFLPREVGLGLAAEVLYTGEVIDAEKAHSIGLVNDVVCEERLIPRAKELGKKMLAKSVLGLRMTKEGLNRNMVPASLESALYLENRNQVICLGSRAILNPLKRG